MLAKLMKYELKATSRLLIPLYLVLLFLSVVNRLLISIPDTNSMLAFVHVLLIFVYIVSVFIVAAVTVIYMIMRFYKNLLGDEGYLMFTLPTKHHDLILSKLLITLLWSITSIAAVLISLYIAFATKTTLPNPILVIKEAIINLNNQYGSSWIIIFIELSIMFLLGLAANILLIYVSIAVGQLFSKHKIVGSFVSYVAIYTAIQSLMMIALVVFGLITKNNLPSFILQPQVIFLIITIGLAVVCTVFYFGTTYIFKRKLNLD